MKKILIMFALVSITVLNAECTTEQIIKLTKKGIDEATIEKVCARLGAKKVQNKKVSNSIDRGRFYAGLTMFSGNGTVSVSSDMYPWYSGDYDADVWGSGLALGYIFDNNNRVELSFGGQTVGVENMEDSDFDYTKISYIHTFGDKQVSIKSFTPFVSLGFQNFVGQNYQIATYDTIEGVGFSIGVGAIYSFNKDVELDIGFASTFIDVGEYYSYDPYSMTYYDAYYDLGYSSITLAAKYKF